MKSLVFKYKVKVDVFQGKIAWYYAMLPKSESEMINQMFLDYKRGWGSLPVSVFCGSTNWETSIFFDNKKKMFMLPLKKAVRVKEDIFVGDEIEVEIVVRD